MFGDGLQTRDFVYVGDVVDAFIAAGDSDADGYCNVATGRETTVLELAETLGLEPGLRAGARGRGAPLVPRTRPPPPRIIGWRARTSLQAGLDRTVASARAAEPGDGAPVASRA